MSRVAVSLHDLGYGGLFKPQAPLLKWGDVTLPEPCPSGVSAWEERMVTFKITISISPQIIAENSDNDIPVLGRTSLKGSIKYSCLTNNVSNLLKMMLLLGSTVA